MASVFVSPKAVEDLDGIKDYIEIELKSPQAAKIVVKKIIDGYEKLAEFPELGAEIETTNAFLKCYRHLVVDNYVVFYRVESGDVFVVRILHRLMDYLKIL